MRLASSSVAFVIALCCAVPAQAGTTGSLRGWVLTDDEETPLVGATIELGSRVLLGGPRFTVTDERGFYRFSELPPGEYDVKVTAHGRLTQERLGIRVEVDRIVERTFPMAAITPETQGGVDQTDDRESGVDPNRVALGRNLRPSFTDKVVTSRTPTGMALVLPGVVEDFWGASLASIHGADGFSNGYYLDGVFVSDPATSGPSGQLNFDSIVETLVLTGGLDAEYGYQSGGVIGVVTSSGADTFDFDSSLYWAPAALRLGDDDELTQVSMLQANIAASGPIIPGTLWFYTSLAAADDTRTTPLEKPVFLETPFMQPRQDRGADLLGKLTFAPLSWQKFSLLLQADPNWLINERQEENRHPRAERQIYTGGLKAAFSSQTDLLEHLTWRTYGSYSIDRTESTPVSNQRELAGRINLATGTATVNDTVLDDNYRSRVQLDSSIALALADLFGTHEIKGGLQAQATTNTILQSLTGRDPDDPDDGGELFLDRGFDQEGTDISGRGDPYRVQRATGPLEKVVAGNIASLYLQDVWNPFRNLTVRGGLRFDSARTIVDPDDGAGLFYQFNWPSPRIGLSWDPFSDGKTAIRGGYYHYADMGNLSLPGRVGRSLDVETFEFNEATGRYDIFVGQEGGERGVLPGDGLLPPATHELILGGSREVFKDASVHVDLVFRQRSNLFEDTEQNVQWNQDGSAATGFLNGRPEPEKVLSTPFEAFQRYIGLDLAFDKRLSDRWSLYASYSLSRLEGTVDGGVGYAFDNPRQAPWEYGFLKNDIRHNARLFLTYDLPYGLTVGVAAQYQSGRPYSKLYYNDYYADWLDRRAPRGYDPNDVADPDDDVELRLPDQFLVNTRLSWRLEELTSQDIWVIVEIRNILNQRPTNLVEERFLGPDPSTSFGHPLARVEPLRATLGLRYRF